MCEMASIYGPLAQAVLHKGYTARYALDTGEIA